MFHIHRSMLVLSVAISAVAFVLVDALPKASPGQEERSRQTPQIEVAGKPAARILELLGAKLEDDATRQQLGDYSSHFDRVDRDGDGRHSKTEYIDKGGYMTPQARRGIFNAADNDKDGFVTKAEYVLNRIITDEAKTIVQGMDDDKDGPVQRQEFIKHATDRLSSAELAQQVFAALDTDGNGETTIPEYLRVWGKWARAAQKSAQDRISARQSELGSSSESPARRTNLEKTRERAEQVLTRVPSTVGNGQGIAVRVVSPERPRYANGAPIVIGVHPGPHDAEGRLGAAECGFVEVFFASTDFGKGPYDFGGPNWLLGLRDVILFAVGRTADKEGRTIGDLTGEIPVLTSNVGTIGLSHGGNACGAVMGLHGQDFPELAWYVSWESPYGEGAVGEELGSPRRANGRVNPAYDPETSQLDLSKLAYDPDLAMTGRGRTPQQRRELPFRGSLFFDMDGNGRYDRQTDFRHQPARFDSSQGPKFWYSIRLLREAERRNLFGDSWPAHIATVAEAKEFWHYRDATGLVPDAIRKIPNLAVIIVANEDDHIQVAPDHPHIRTQANAFQKAGARFVRVNPDRAYVQWLIGESRPGLVDNNAGALYTPKTIRAALCPNEAAHRILQVAAICELADRVQADNFQPNLHRVLFPDAPKAAGPPLRRGPQPPRGQRRVTPPSRQGDNE